MVTKGRWDPRNTWLSRTAGSERRAPSASCAPGKAISRDTESVYYILLVYSECTYDDVAHTYLRRAHNLRDEEDCSV